MQKEEKKSVSPGTLKTGKVSGRVLVSSMDAITRKSIAPFEAPSNFQQVKSGARKEEWFDSRNRFCLLKRLFFQTRINLLLPRLKKYKISSDIRSRLGEMFFRSIAGTKAIAKLLLHSVYLCLFRALSLLGLPIETLYLFRKLLIEKGKKKLRTTNMRGFFYDLYFWIYQFQIKFIIFKQFSAFLIFVQTDNQTPTYHLKSLAEKDYFLLYCQSKRSSLVRFTKKNNEWKLLKFVIFMALYFRI